MPAAIGSRSSRSAAARSRTPRRAARARSSSPTDGDLDQQAARDFLDCVKSRKRPNADIEEGHRSTTFAHLANIALATRKRLDWDPQAERFTNCDAGQPALALRVSQALESGVSHVDRRLPRLSHSRVDSAYACR